MPVLVDVPLHVVRVHGVRAHAHRFRGFAFSEAILLCHHVPAYHPARLAHVDLVRPVAVVREFVLGEAPAGHLFADVSGHPRIVRDEVHQALLVQLVLADDFPAPGVGRLWIVVIHADVIGGERAVVVGVRLGVRNRVELVECLSPARLVDAKQYLVLPRIVALGLCEGNAVFGNRRQAHAKAVRLNPVVALSFVPGRVRTDAGQEPA